MSIQVTVFCVQPFPCYIFTLKCIMSSVYSDWMACYNPISICARGTVTLNPRVINIQWHGIITRLHPKMYPKPRVNCNLNKSAVNSNDFFGNMGISHAMAAKAGLWYMGLFRAGVPRGGISSSLRTAFGRGTKGPGSPSPVPLSLILPPPPPVLPPPPLVRPILPLYSLPPPLRPQLRKPAINMPTIINPPMLPPTIAPMGTFVRGADVDGGDCVGEGEGGGASWHTFET